MNSETKLPTSPVSLMDATIRPSPKCRLIALGIAVIGRLLSRLALASRVGRGWVAGFGPVLVEGEKAVAVPAARGRLPPGSSVHAVWLRFRAAASSVQPLLARPRLKLMIAIGAISRTMRQKLSDVPG